MTMLTHFNVILCVFLLLKRNKLHFRALYFSPSPTGPDLFTASGQFSCHSSDAGRASGLFQASSFFYFRYPSIIMVMKRICRAGGNNTMLLRLSRAARMVFSVQQQQQRVLEEFRVKAHAIKLPVMCRGQGK